MRKINIALLGILAVIFVGCSGSESYRGSWKAMNSEGTKFELFFDAKNFTVKDSLGKIQKYKYSQNSVSIENSVSTYGIQLGDGRNYKINFPNSSNESVGLIKDENDIAIYTIGRKDFIKYEDIFKL